MNYRELMRKKLLEDIYDKMSEDEKRTFVQLTLKDKDHREIMQALSRQNEKIEDVSKKIGEHPFATDLFSNVLGNGITGSLIWIGSLLFKKL